MGIKNNSNIIVKKHSLKKEIQTLDNRPMDLTDFSSIDFKGVDMPVEKENMERLFNKIKEISPSMIDILYDFDDKKIIYNDYILLSKKKFWFRFHGETTGG